MTTPKMPQVEQSVMRLKTHRVKNPQGKIYTYRGMRLDLWFSEEDFKIIEIAYNYIKTAKHPEFTDKELSTLPKFLKNLIVKSSKRFKTKYVDQKLE